MLFQLEGVKKYYDSRLVLDIPALSLPAHRIYALTGPNGAGKTTLLRLLSFLDTPSYGKILFCGQAFPADRSTRTQLRRQVSLVFQSPLLFHTTVYQNVAYGLKVRGFPRRKIANQVEKALEMVGLQGFSYRKAWQLSGGEIQRVAIARALALEPQVLLLDEPMANLDTPTVSLLENLIQNLKREKGMTILLTSHNFLQIQRLADEVYTLQAGRIIKTVQPNILTGTVVQQGTEYWFDTGNLRIALATEIVSCRAIMLHPQDIVLSREPCVSGTRNVFAGRITKLEECGPQRVAVTVDAGEPLLVHISPQSLERLGLTLGSSVIASFKSTAVEVIV